ncbi:Signal transduction histidine kinase CheA [hydrothermal vent metagenome]|uniref:Chemotaxis protein CheA n=1 Tax=hydrothermal vent metagenome TaxID=652676 RepID=A0A3B1B6D5_9ZZZZ
MSIDISQFLQTFYEESFEGLDIMESELLNLNVGSADKETINTIFRAAHSIKGGSGTFGLSAVADYTHILETLLDEMRDDKRDVTQHSVDLMLQSVDVLREMLTALQENHDLDHDRIAASHAQLTNLLAEGTGTSSMPAAASSNAAENKIIEPHSNSGWIIDFIPFPEMMRTGNDPVRIIRELDELGELTIELDDEKIPSLDEIEAENCYLAWKLSLQTDADEAVIRDIFSWVDDECDLKITPIAVREEYSGPERRAAEPAQKDRRVADRRSKTKEQTSIRVGIDKVDDLINMVGELVITQSMLHQLHDVEEFNQNTLDRLQDGLAQLEQHTRELQENVMRIRMMPISFTFQRFPRLVRDLSNQFGKSIELKLTGEQTELDKTVMEKIGDPLVHLVRNSLDHGIEMPDIRAAAGKPETGTIELNAFHQGGNIVIEIKDDGAGLNTSKILQKAKENGMVKDGDILTAEQINDLIFQPGFSTADVVSDVSGRGVGMDVVRRNIRSLNGTVEVVSSPGAGSVFTIRLPLTLAILDGQLVRVGNETYVIPLIAIIESLQVKSECVNAVTGSAEVYKLRDEYIPILRLYEIFELDPDNKDLTKGMLVVVESEGQKLAIFVDELLSQQQVVIKSLETNFRKIDGLSGATILGDGTVALIADIVGVYGLYQKNLVPAELKVIQGGGVAA